MVTTREYTINNSTTEVTLLTSPFHIEVDLSAVGSKDRVIVQELIKELAQTRNVESLLELKSSKKPKSANGKIIPPYKVLVLSPCSALSASSQQALRRTMETYSGNIKLILVTDSLSKIIQPVRSRCMCIRVPAISDAEAEDVIRNIIMKEGVDVDDSVIKESIQRSNGNLRVAILSIQASLTAGEGKLVPEWELAIESIIDSVVSCPYPTMILEVRKKLFALLANCVPPQIILESLLAHFRKAKKGINDGKFFDAAYWAAVISKRLAVGSHPIIHLETFVARLMVIVG